MSDRASGRVIPGQDSHASLLGRLLDEQIQNWQSGTPVLVETILEQHPALLANPDALLDLLYREIMLREERGETPCLAEYLVRFPALAEQLHLLFEVEHALQRKSLLPPHQNTTQPYTIPAATGAPAQLFDSVVTVSCQEREIAGYRIQSVLGEGGMGIVYKAWQEALQRVVALKMSRGLGQPSAVEITRFLSEAKAVARLQHPNIVQIHEVGQQAGRPFFSMEFIDGVTLSKQLAGTPQPAVPAADLVETLARAVHYAHEQGIVHRDLKPANVLLQRNGQPKITDFGLAKFVGGDSQTMTGAILGTPSYMAPEQAAGLVHEIGPLADVYALGAILYEALTGRPPFRGPTVTDTLQQVRFNEPVPPSRLQPSCPRDLETICLKCLRKEPAKRYGSALELAEDLHRFQTGQPIKARPVGAVERALKWAKRERWKAALIAVSTVLGLAILVVSWVYSISLNAEVRRANAEARRAEWSLDDALRAVERLLAKVGEIDLANVPQMEQYRKDMLREARTFCQEFLKKRGTDPKVRQMAGRVSSRLGDIQEMLDEDRDAETAYNEAILLLRGRVAETADDSDAKRELARALHKRGVLLKKSNRANEAEQSLNEALGLRQQLADVNQDPDYRQDQAETFYYLGALLARLKNRLEEAETAYQNALSLQMDLVANFPERRDYRSDLARTSNNRGNLLWRLGQTAKAQQEYQQTVEVWRQLAQDYPKIPGYRFYLARMLNNLAGSLEHGKPRESEQNYRQARNFLAGLAADFPTVSRYREEKAATANNLGRLLRDQKWTIPCVVVGGGAGTGWESARFAQAESALREAWHLREKLAQEFPALPDYQHKWARTNLDLGVLLHEKRPWEAEKAYRDSIALLQRLAADFPDNSEYRVDLTLTLSKLAKLLLNRGKLREPPQGARLVLPRVGGIVPTDLGVLAQAHASLFEASLCLDLAFQHQQRTRKTPASRQILADLYFTAAETYLRRGLHSRAEAVAKQMQDLDDKIQYLRAARVLAECVPLAAKDPFLKKTYADKAVAMLQQAVKRGFNYVKELDDPRYVPLRPLDDFQKLRKKMEKN